LAKTARILGDALFEIFADDEAGCSWFLQSALADRIGITRGAISKLADRLAAKRLIERLDDEKDGRIETPHLTEKGRKVVPVLSALADQNDAEFFGHLGASDRRSLEATMKAILKRKGFRAVPVDQAVGTPSRQGRP
jgi:DNA-binding MarR family transcriptional regulator